MDFLIKKFSSSPQAIIGRHLSGRKHVRIMDACETGILFVLFSRILLRKYPIEVGVNVLCDGIGCEWVNTGMRSNDG